jgi:hypothetical protein
MDALLLAGRSRAILRERALGPRRRFRFRAAGRRGKLRGVKARRRVASAPGPDPSDPPDPADPGEYRRLRRTASACRRNYLGRRDVLDVGVGLKYRAGRRSDEGLCVQFCVRRKLRRPGARRLPRFVYARRRDGALDRGRRVATDVVALGSPRFACGAGTLLQAPGELGTLTLLFRNRPDGRFYGLTCAHVAGSLERSPPADPRLASPCCRARRFATTVASSVAERGVVDWDIALARLEPGCTPRPERRVEGSPRRLRRLRAASVILPGSFVECAAARSGRFSAVVASDARTLRVRLDRVEYRVRNLFLIEARLLPGDGGAPVFAGAVGVGTLVAVAGDDAPGRAGWGLFQPLDGALDHLAERCGFPLRCFD